MIKDVGGRCNAFFPNSFHHFKIGSPFNMYTNNKTAFNESKNVKV